MDPGSDPELAPLRRHMLYGAGLFLVLSSVNFVIRGTVADVSVAALLVVSVAVGLLGALAGALHYATDSWRSRGGAFTTLANVAPILTVGVLVLALLGILARFGG